MSATSPDAETARPFRPSGIADRSQRSDKSIGPSSGSSRKVDPAPEKVPPSAAQFSGGAAPRAPPPGDRRSIAQRHRSLDGRSGNQALTWPVPPVRSRAETSRVRVRSLASTRSRSPPPSRRLGDEGQADERHAPGRAPENRRCIVVTSIGDDLARSPAIGRSSRSSRGDGPGWQRPRQ